VIKFTVPGPLYAYRRIKDKGSYKKYGEYKNRVLGLAMEAGWKGRADSVPEFPVKLSINVSWKKNPRIDASNVLKGIEDALFEQDRWILDVRVIMFPKQKEESAVVEVGW
jgi:hypothetical protein